MAEKNNNQVIEAEVNEKGEVVETNNAPVQQQGEQPKKGWKENLKDGWENKAKPIVKKVAIGAAGAAALVLAFAAGEKIGEHISDKKDQKFDPAPDPTLAIPEIDPVALVETPAIEETPAVPEDAPSGFEEV